MSAESRWHQHIQDGPWPNVKMQNGRASSQLEDELKECRMSTARSAPTGTDMSWNEEQRFRQTCYKTKEETGSNSLHEDDCRLAASQDPTASFWRFTEMTRTQMDFSSASKCAHADCMRRPHLAFRHSSTLDGSPPPCPK